MNYTLAKQLKDAGFQLRLVIGAGSWNGDKVFFDNGVDVTGEKIGFLPPTLSELIEACGERFMYLHKKEGEWLAEDRTFEFQKRGPTPEEAVANLWLELKKK